MPVFKKQTWMSTQLEDIDTVSVRASSISEIGCWVVFVCSPVSDMSDKHCMPVKSTTEHIDRK